MPITSATLVVKDVYNGGKSYTFEVSADVERTDQNTNTAATQPPLSARLRSRNSTPTGLGRRDVPPPFTAPSQDASKNAFLAKSIVTYNTKLDFMFVTR